MSRRSILVRALPRNRLGNISKKVYGSSLANTVHQNYALGVKKLKDQLDAKGGKHLSTEVLLSAMRGLVSAALWGGTA